MHQNSLVAAIKVNNQVLREVNPATVIIPFGSEYSLFLKNLNSVRMQVKVSIDGEDVTSGTWLVINANRSLELERFILNGNWGSGNRFKFIERIKEVEAHRGVKAEDGIVRVEFQIERKLINDRFINDRFIYDESIFRGRPKSWCDVPRKRWAEMRPEGRRPMSPLRASGMRSLSRSSSASSSRTRSSVGAKPNITKSDVGITVPGSVSNQQFMTVAGFETLPSEVLILHLRGEVLGNSVKQPITVKTKLSCSSCGKTSKVGNDFCSHCGTALVLL